MSTTTINSTSDATALSAADRVQSELDLLTARLRRDVWLYGLLAVAAIAVGVLLVATISDAILQPESTGLRFALWSSVLAAGAVATYRFVWLPLQTRCNNLALAWSLEEQRPELQEGLTSTLLLADNEQPTSAALIDAVAAQANRNLADCRDDAATRRDMRTPAMAAASCVVVATFCFAGWPQYLLPSLSNVMAPWRTRQLPYLTASISPGDVSVAEGEHLEVSALGNDLHGCVLEFLDGSEVRSSTPMTVTATGDEANALLSELTTDQHYRVRSGPLVSDDYRITVHPRPVVTAAKATLQFPEYTGIEPATIDELSAPIAAVPGTQVRLSVATNIPNSDTRLTFADRQQPPAETVQAKDSWWHHWNLRVDDEPVQPGRLELISEHDVPSEPFLFEIRSLPDQPPTVSIKTPTLQQLTVQPDGQLPIQFDAADDFGLQSVELLIQTSEAEPQREAILLGPAAASHAAEYVFSPQQHELEVGDQLVLWFVATDNRTDEFGGTQTAESRQLMITVTDDAVSVGGQQVIDEQNRISESLSDAIERLQEAKETAQQIADAKQQADADGAKDVPAKTNADAQQLQEQLQDAQKALENAAESNDDDAGMFETQKQQVRDIANEDVEEARQQARTIPLTSDPEQQQQAAEAARSAIEQAEEKLAALQEQLNGRADKLQQAAELDELARQQNELARRMEEEESPPQEAKPKQEEIADRLQDLVEEDLEAKSEQFRQRADAAEQLVEKTDQLQEQQQQLTDPAEGKTDEETREQLTEMLRKEQEALAADHQQLTDEAPQQAADPENKTAPKNEQAAADAQQRMEQAEKDLANRNLQAAEENVAQAKQKLQEAVAPQDEENADAAQKEQQQAKTKGRERLAKRQERIEDAIRAVKEDDFEKAKDELQNLITDRVEQATKEAEELLEQPTDDEENQKACEEAKQKLQEALDDSRQAAAEPQDQKDAQPQEQADATEEQANKDAQQQSGKQEKKDGEPQAQQPGAKDKDQAATQNDAGQKKAQQQQEAAAQEQARKDAQQQPGKQQKKDGEPQAQQPGEKNKDQVARQNDAGQKKTQQQQQAQKQPAQQQQQKARQKQKQDKAAQSLKEASESLQKFCKSCKKCANCNKPSKSGGSSGNSSSPSGKQAGGQQAGEKQAGEKQAGEGDRKKSGTSKQLAKTTDKAQKAARKPTPGTAKQLARELDELADDAAQKSGYPTRKDGKGKSGRDKKGAQKKKSGTDKKKGDQDGSKSPSGEPKGVDGNGDPDDINTKGIQLRGPSSSEWTRSHKRLRGNVLDSKSTQIPEAYRGVVENYFEQLSKIESDFQKPEGSK